MLLHVPVACEFFYDYLEKFSDDPNSPIYFTLYAELRYYEKAFTEVEDETEKHKRAQTIWNEYLAQGGEHYVQIE